MIQANELRIGNWVLVVDEPVQVTGIWDNVIKYKEDGEIGGRIKPISLTPEILEKCGFKRTGELTFDHNDGNFIRESSDQYWYYVKTTGNLRSIQHLHQLQNLYFALTGNELEINLTEEKIR